MDGWVSPTGHGGRSLSRRPRCGGSVRPRLQSSPQRKNGLPNVDFAILTHHKNIFQPAIGAPILTLGTVIKSVDKYYVCIQQRCDSVRIKEERRFLFLPLEEKGEYPLIVNNELKLFPNKSSFAIKTVKFKPKEGATIIQASKKEDKYVFYSSYGETYEWVVDLKEMQAQRILNSYCAQLSRVGLNESEWLRLIAKQ